MNSGKSPAVKPMAKPTEKPKAGGMVASKTPIAEHVEQHGPAHAIEYKEVGGKHHVTSHHGDSPEGMHHSVHHNAEAAHDHMAKAMGVGQGMTEESPDAANDNEAPEGGGIPGLSV